MGVNFRFRSVPTFPTNVSATNGLVLTKENGNWVFAIDWDSLPDAFPAVRYDEDQALEPTEQETARENIGYTLETALQIESRGIVSITDARFGASLTDGTVGERTTAIQAAIDYGANNGVAVYFPAGTWVINDSLSLPSFSRLKGAGMYSTIIQMEDSVLRNVNVLSTGSSGNQRLYIEVEDMTIDANIERWSEVGGDGRGVAVNIVNCHHSVFRNVYAKDAANICFDIAGPVHPVFSLSSGEYQYFDDWSSHIKLIGCRASGGGDDNIVCHNCTDIDIIETYSHDPKGPLKDQHNSNCFEVDGSARNVRLLNCKAKGGYCGIQVKGHDGEPAPYQVKCDGLTVINCGVGVSLRHSNGTRTMGDMDADHDGTTTEYSLDADDAPLWENSTLYEVGDLVTSPTSGNIFYCFVGHTSRASGTFGQDVSDNPTWWKNYPKDVASTPGTIDDAFSPTAYNLIFNNTTIIAPRLPDLWIEENEAVSDIGGIVDQNYSSVIFTNTIISDGTEDIGNKEWEPYSFAPGIGSPSVGVIRMAVGARRRVYNGLIINGFASEATGISSTSTGGDAAGDMDLIINGLVMRNAPRAAVVFNDDLGNIIVDNFYISGDHIGDSTIGLNFGSAHSPSESNQSAVGFGEIRGYDTTLRIAGNLYTKNVFFPSKPVMTLSADGGFLMGNGSQTPISAARGWTAASSGAGGWASKAESTALRNHYFFEDPNGLVGKISSAAGRLHYYTVGDTVFITGGSGSPEGAVTAPVGSLYTRSNGGAGTSLYIKESGSGNTGWAVVTGGNALLRDVEDQTLSGGFRVTAKDLGTITTGTVTLDPGDRPLQYYTNNGAHTLSPAAFDGATQVLITNDASAGAITTSDYDVVNGDAFSTTNGHRFLCTSRRINGYEVLTVEAMQ